MDVSREELEALCAELGRVYEIFRQDDRDASAELLRIKVLSCWKEMIFYLDSTHPS